MDDLKEPTAQSAAPASLTDEILHCEPCLFARKARIRVGRAEGARTALRQAQDRRRMFGGGWLALGDCGGGCWRWCLVWWVLGRFDQLSALPMRAAVAARMGGKHGFASGNCALRELNSLAASGNIGRCEKRFKNG